MKKLSLNKADGKATFSKLTFQTKLVLTIIQLLKFQVQIKTSITTKWLFRVVTENAQGDLQASVKYSAEGGFKSSADDKSSTTTL